MTKRSTLFLLGVTAVSAMAAPGTFSTSLSGGAFAAELAGGHVAAVASPVAGPSDGWYQFGPAATVVERREIPADNVTLVTLSNGMRLVLKPTDLVDDEVLVNVMIDGGYHSLAPGDRAAVDIASEMFMRGGVGLKTYDELVADFGPAVSSIEFNVWSGQFNFQGTAKPNELRPILEVLAGYASDPGWRFNDLEATRAMAVNYAAVAISNPIIAFTTQAPGLLASGDQRYVQPTAAQYQAVGQDDLRRAIEGQFKSGAIEIAIVGDFDKEAAIAMAAETFGTLPARAGLAPDQSASFPAHTTTPLEITFTGYPEQQGRLIAWPAPRGLFKSKEEQVIGAMFGVMAYRLMELPAYQAGGFGKGLSAQNGYMYISIVGPRENLGAFDADVARIARDIVEHGVTQEEIDRAQAQAAADARTVQAQVPNLYWLIAAMNLKGDPANWEKARSFMEYIGGVTPEEVQGAAARYLIADRSVSIVANSESAPPSQ